MVELLVENMLLIVGLGFGVAMLGLRKLALKTENKLDDQAVAKAEENKAGIVAKVSALLVKLLRK